MAELTEDQKKIKDLETQVRTLTDAKKAADSKVDQLTAESASKDAQIATLTTAKASVEKQVEAALKVVQDLKDQLADQIAGSVKLPTFKIGADTYELTTDFFYKNQEITLAVLTEDTALAQELIREGVANLRKVATKAKA